MHRCVIPHKRTGAQYRTNATRVIIGIGICAMPIGHLNVLVRRIIETYWSVVSVKCIDIYNLYSYLCDAHTS